jgi:hypothetical protein
MYRSTTLLLSLVFCALAAGLQAQSLVLDDGTETSLQELLGRRTRGLVCLASPWEGRTATFLQTIHIAKLKKTRGFLPLVVFTEGSHERITHFVASQGWTFRWALDGSAAFLRQYSPPVLPWFLFLDREQTLVHQSSIVPEQVVRLLGRRPGRAFGNLARMSLQEYRKELDPSPWGPPTSQHESMTTKR